MSEHTCEFGDGPCPACDPSFAAPTAGGSAFRPRKTVDIDEIVREFMNANAERVYHEGFSVVRKPLAALLHDLHRKWSCPAGGSGDGG